MNIKCPFFQVYIHVNNIQTGLTNFCDTDGLHSLFQINDLIRPFTGA